MRSIKFFNILLILVLFTFIAAPLPLLNNSIKADAIGDNIYYLIHITDLHLGSGSANVSKMYEFADDVRNVFLASGFKPIVLIDTGDIVDDPVYADEWYPVYRSVMDFWPDLLRLDTAGNHDVYSYKDSSASGWDKWYEYFGSPTYKWDLWINDYEYIRFIAINTSDPTTSSGNIEDKILDLLETWLDEAENDPSCREVWVFMHHPPAPNSNEVVDLGGWDYKATPYNTIIKGDPWRLVRVINSYSKVRGVLYGHVHENYVTRHYGKYWIGTAPLTLPGPWQADWNPSRYYTGIGYAYRLVAVDNDVVSTLVTTVGQWPIGFITNIEQGSVLSGVVEVHALAFSEDTITKVELWIDSEPAAYMSAVEANSYGGLYVGYIDVEALDNGPHYMEVHVVDSSGREYWSPRLYFFARAAGGIMYARSMAGMISFGVRENYPVAWLKVYSEYADQELPFAALFIPATHSGGNIRIKALVSTEHIPWNMKMRFALTTSKETLVPDDGYDVSEALLKLVAGMNIEKDYTYPYDLCLWRQTNSRTGWGDYLYFQDYWPAVGYWLQVTYYQDYFLGEVWMENETYWDGANSLTWTYRTASNDYDDINYAIFLVRSDPGYYSQASIAYFEVNDANGKTGYSLVPNILGVPTLITITDYYDHAGYVYIAVELKTIYGDPVADGTIIIQGSSDGIHWYTLTTLTLQDNSDTVFTFIVPQEVYYRAVYKPNYDPWHMYNVHETSPVEAVSSPVYHG